MGGVNEPRRMTPRGKADDAGDFNNVTGDAGRDGFTRIARREPRGTKDGPYPFFGPVSSDAIQPQVGERDWNRGPRYSED